VRAEKWRISLLETIVVKDGFQTIGQRKKGGRKRKRYEIRTAVFAEKDPNRARRNDFGDGWEKRDYAENK